MASSINSTSAGNGGLISTGDDSGILNIQTNETTAITVDASQKVGIGTTSPQNTLGINVALADTKGLVLQYNGEAKAGFLLNPTSGEVRIGAIQTTGAYFPTFYSNNAEAMRLDTSGNLLVGTTSINSGDLLNGTGCGHFYSGSSNGQLFLRNTSAGNVGWYVGADSSNQLRVYNQNGTGVLLTSGNTSWSSTSDERLKTDLAPIQDSLQKVSALRAVTGRFKTDEEGVSRSFLIAQDFEGIFPQALDASNEEALSLKYTEVIPLLVASIKELKAINDTQAEKINALTARIVALETA